MIASARFWAAFLFFTWTALLAWAETAGGKVWIDLTLQDSSDSTSALKSWPAQSDLTTEPANAAVAEVIWQILLTVRNAPQNTSPSTPQLGQGGEEFIENLQALLTEKGFVLADGFEISDQAPPSKTRLGVEYLSFSGLAPTPALPVAFEIWVRTNLLPPNSPAQQWHVRDLAANPAVSEFIRAQSGSASIAVASSAIPESYSLIILPAEGPWLREVTTSRDDASGFTPIFAAAVAVAQGAIHQQILEKPRTPQNRDTLATALHGSFSAWPMTGEIAFQDELSAVDFSYQKPDQPAWVLRLTNFDPVRRQSVSINEIQLGAQGRQPWATFAEHQQRAGKNIGSLIAQKAALETKLTALLERDFTWNAPRFATADDVQSRIAALSGQPGVAAVESRIFRDEIAYSVTWYPVLTTWEASGTYNSDRGGNVNSKLSVQARNFGANVEGFIANRRRGLFADLSTTPKAIHLPDQATSTWSLFGDYTRENPVRFGTPKNFSLEDEETRTGLRWRIEGGHSEATSASQIRSRRWKMDVAAGYRRAQLSADNFSFTGNPDGEAPFASTDFTGELEQGAKGAAQTATFRLELNADASPAHRSTANFARGQFKATEEIRVGHDRFENSLVRLTASGGAATDDTPLAWWYRLGGDERMRGFELGELTGRSFFHAGIEAGIGLGSFLSKPTPRDPAAARLPFDLQQIRILFGVEHAWMSDPPTFFPPINSLRHGWSYSLTGEYTGAIPGLPGNSKLALGYGYAPESSHRSGRVFVTLRVPLSIPQSP